MDDGFGNFVVAHLIETQRGFYKHGNTSGMRKHDIISLRKGRYTEYAILESWKSRRS